MLPEIVEKFQSDLELFGEALVERIQELLPDLSPEEQQDTPILMSDSVHATVLFCPTLKYTTSEASYTGEGCVFKCDIVLENNNLTFNVGDYIGMTYDVSWAKDVSLENSNNSTIFFELNHEGDLSAALNWDGFTVKLYYEGAYHSTDIRFKIDAPVTNRKLNLYLSTVRAGAEGIASYDVNSEIVSWTPAKDIKPQSGGQVFYALASYPFIGNFKDTTNINNWITNNGATNNYTNTYTTPDNKTITIYYGDNYIITHVNDDEPVSYNDVKNALNIAVNQINDDNDIDLEVPDYPIPPPPDPDDDDTDGQDFGAGTSLGGSDMLWLLTSQQMSDFHSALNGGITTGFNPFDSIISVMGLAIPPTYLFDDIEVITNIVIPKPDGTSWSSGVSGHICTSQKSAFGFVDLSVDRIYNNFLDFSPYSTHEIFIPMCGWLPLPDIAVNRKLCIYYVPDVQNCSVRGLVGIYGDGGKVDIIGEKYGAMGAQVPITNTGHALFVSGAISGGVQTLANGLNGIFGAAGTDNPWFGGSGVMSAIATGTQSMMNTQRNISSVIGQNQDRSSFSDGTHIMIKSSYPQIKLDPLYGHTHGFVCYRSGQLSEFSGFTVCENPHVGGFTCTSSEKDEITRLLERGVILPTGE